MEIASLKKAYQKATQDFGDAPVTFQKVLSDLNMYHDGDRIFVENPDDSIDFLESGKDMVEHLDKTIKPNKTHYGFYKKLREHLEVIMGIENLKKAYDDVLAEHGYKFDNTGKRPPLTFQKLLTNLNIFHDGEKVFTEKQDDSIDFLESPKDIIEYLDSIAHTNHEHHAFYKAFRDCFARKFA